MKKQDDVTYITGSEEYITRIRNKYDILSDSEKQVANYFLHRDVALAFDYNVKDIASATNTSVATVVRFCKSIGYKGFAEFKFSVRSGQLAPIGGKVKIGSNDDMGTIKQKVAEFARQNITSTVLHTDNTELERAIDAIETCGQMIITATGTSSGVAMSLANAFMIMGVKCQYVSDPLTLLRTVSFLKKGDILIGITNCGFIKDVVDAMKVAQDCRATTICVTGSQDCLAEKYADIILNCMIKDYSSPLDVLTVTICQLITLQTVQVGYLSRRSDVVAEKIKDLYSLTEMTRYALDLEEIQNKRMRF